MSRFINQLPRMKVCEAFGTGARVAYNNLAHGDAYIPDKWSLAWGKHAKELASDIIKFVNDDPKIGVGSYIKNHLNPKLMNHSDTQTVHNEDPAKAVSPEAKPEVASGAESAKEPAKESVAVVEDASTDYSHYIKLCNDAIAAMQNKQAEFIETLEKSKFAEKEFESKPKVVALYTILQDSFKPEPKSETPEEQNDGTENGDGADGAAQGGDGNADAQGGAAQSQQVDGQNGTQVQQGGEQGTPGQGQRSNTSAIGSGFEGGYKSKHVNRAKVKNYPSVLDMINDFKVQYDKKGEVTNRIVTQMFGIVDKMRKQKPVDPSAAAEVAKTALNNVGAPNAARAVV